VAANVFGDRIGATCFGTIYVTDLRVIFLPSNIRIPLHRENISIPHNGNLDEKQILYLHRFTVQIPISSISECKFFPTSASGVNTTTSTTSYNNPIIHNDVMLEFPRFSLLFELFDNSVIEFVITKKPQLKSVSMRMTKLPDLGVSHPSFRVSLREKLKESEWYKYGLDTKDVDPAVWCARVVDFLSFEMRQDLVWLRWAKYMKNTIKVLLSSASNKDKGWLKKIRSGTNLLDLDYQRYNFQDLSWQFSDLNSAYNLCPSYPSILVFPGSLTDDELVNAASQRSIGRLPAMVWLHGNTKAALCRSSQPMAGLSGNTIEFDRKLCLSIKNAAPMQLPLRIADARPRLNANANAVQGKGFENVTFLGGAANVSLVFLDIENIHVVRSSFNKVKEGLTLSSSYNSVVDGGITTANSTTNNQSFDAASTSAFAQITASKWINHIASILRGSVGVADSLTAGYPVLVHCSDGW
jgi:hypothetical protein